jgi:hypothetical protein
VASTKARIDAAKRRGGGAPKKASGPPDLLPENLLPWAVFRSCLSQLIVGPAGGVIGVSHDSLDLKFRIFRVPPDREAEVWEKFELLESVLIEEVNHNLTSLSDASPKAPSRGRRGREQPVLDRA